MNLQDWANVAQLVSALAVIVPLAYVAYEVRQGARELRLGAQQAQTDAQVDYMCSARSARSSSRCCRRRSPARR